MITEKIIAAQPSRSFSQDGMKAEQAETNAPKLCSAAINCYAQTVRELPWGMSALHLRNPGWQSTRTLGPHTRATRLPGGKLEIISNRPGTTLRSGAAPRKTAERYRERASPPETGSGRRKSALR
jgi:hypothetical protein